jgi:hypothetical protein
MLVDGTGVILSLVVTGANRHDVSSLETLLDTFVSIRPDILNTLNIGVLIKGRAVNWHEKPLYYGDSSLTSKAGERREPRNKTPGNISPIVGLLTFPIPGYIVFGNCWYGLKN